MSFIKRILGIVFLLAGLVLTSLQSKGAGVVTDTSEASLNTALLSGGTVTFACDGTIVITNTKSITINTILDASGHNITISGGGNVQIFSVSNGVNLTLFNLGLSDGVTTTNGGAIYNDGTLVASNCTFTANHAEGTNGVNGVDSGNGPDGTPGKAGGNAYGGAIFNRGILILNICMFEDNLALGGLGGNGGRGDDQGPVGGGGDGGNGGAGGIGQGGAIYSTNTIFITNCTFEGNYAVGGDGGNGGARGFGSTSTGGTGGKGGEGSGAGIYAFRDSVIINSTFYQNSGNGGWSGASLWDSFGSATARTGGASFGGGICNKGTNRTINCTFFNNQVYGGRGGLGGTDATGDGGNGSGGGLYSSGQIGVTNCTFNLCGAFAGAAGSYGADTGSVLGGQIARSAGTFSLKNTILGPKYSLTGKNASGTIIDGGNNLSFDNTPTLLTSNGSHINTDPLVEDLLSDLGGYTRTCALLPGSPAINSGNDLAAPQYDQRGYMRIDTSDIGSFEFGSSALGVLSLGPVASQDGDIGLFFITGLPFKATVPFTVNFLLSGTASNGVDYIEITNSITIPIGADNVRIPVHCIPGAFSGGNKSVTLSLISGTNYQVNAHDLISDSATVILSDHSSYDRRKRFWRGTSSAPDFQSLIVPVDFEAGVRLDDIGGNATNFFPGNLWTNTLYHFDATNATAVQTNISGRIPFQNPIVAFGARVGGSPLYLNRNYEFGVFAGEAVDLTNSLRIQVYNRSNASLAGTISMPIPDVTKTNQLTQMITNGFTAVANEFGLRTTLFVSITASWGLHSAHFSLTHNASDAATNYFFVIEQQGKSLDGNYLVLNQSNSPDWSRLYALEFDKFPSSRSTFIDQPHFEGKPLPPAYLGKSVQEMTNITLTLPDLSFLVATNYLTLDGSPELRRHPILDEFAKDLGHDPLAIANYVINEIDLTDAIDYDTNHNNQISVNLGGVNRSALATFQEGQGSPLEQCALLVYLLRQSGVPAAYIFPTNNSLSLLDFQLSKLLRIQLHGALNEIGQTNLLQTIPVNYPWVAAYIGTNWIQIFPWMKDTEIKEGFNFYDYMPTNYDTGFKWLQAFTIGDTNIFSLNSSDQPLDLLPAFIQKHLDSNAPGLSVDDMGVQFINRRHLYSRWSDFPKPFSFSGTPVVIESLKTNLNLFDTIEIQVSSSANPSKVIDTTELRIADLHNRRLLLKFLQVGSNNVHDMVLSLAAFAPNITNLASFSTNADPTWKLVTTNRLDSTDDYVIFKVIHRRNRFLPSNYVASEFDSATNLWNYHHFESGEQTAGVYESSDTFRKGDLVAFCLDTGIVSPKMLNAQAQEIWNFNQTVDTNQPSTIDFDIYIGTTTYLMGMSYFNYYDRFLKLNSRLHKLQTSSHFEYGFGLLKPQRDVYGLLVSNGVVNPITPAVHMPHNGDSFIFNGALRADSGRETHSTAYLNSWAHDVIAGSAAEHGVLQSYFRTNAISTVKLLQQVGTNRVILNSSNYQAAGNVLYHGVALKDAAPGLWDSITTFFSVLFENFNEKRIAFVTPGVVTNGSYSGVGALLFSPYQGSSLVSGLNGGFGQSFPVGTFGLPNAGNIILHASPEGSVTPFYLQTSPFLDEHGFINGATVPWQLPLYYSALANSTLQLDPALALSLQPLEMLYGTPDDPAAAYNTLFNTGAASTEPSFWGDVTRRVLDPVDVMTGEFYVDAVDLSLPGPMPLQIRRNYGSHNLAENEFGAGWKSSLVPFLSLGTNSTLIYAAEMDGSFIAYRQTATNANLWLPQPQDNPTLNNNSTIGIGSVANLFNNRLHLNPGDTNVYVLSGSDGSTRTFTERSYPIGTFARQRPYLDSWCDSRGNSYIFEYGTNSFQAGYGEVRRIQSSSGGFIGFYYDPYGHIIEAYTGDGRRIRYEYDKFGDLTSVTLPDQSQTTYEYQHTNGVFSGITNEYSTHLLVKELKPDGRILQNAYDFLRRVTNQLSTAGADLVPIRTGSFTYTNNFSLSSPTNLLTGRTDLYDFTNNVTTYYYTNGLMRRIVDPLNATILQDWYETNSAGGFQRSLKSVTDKRGLQTVYLYDPVGNLTNRTITGDLLGDGSSVSAATSASYNTNNLPTDVIDPVGNKVKTVYSAVYPFLPEQIIFYAGGTAIKTNLMVYYNVTNFATNGTTIFTNLACGLREKEIRAYGSSDSAMTERSHDGRGFITQEIKYSGTSINVTNSFIYNDRGEMVEKTDAAGRRVNAEYDAAGRLQLKQVFESGQELPISWDLSYYNENGELTWSDGPRFDPEDYVWRDYDGSGRKIQEIRWRSRAKLDGSGIEAETGDNLYATTFYEYDGFGNLTKVIDPRHNYSVMDYDAVGQMIRKTTFDGATDVALATNQFAYEPGGQVSISTNAVGGITRKFYTSTGKLKRQENPDGSVQEWRYYLDGRLQKEILPNGNYWETVYNDALRKTTRTFKTSTGTILSSESREFDRRGNVIKITDALNNVFTKTYDDLDRIKTEVGPYATAYSAQQMTTFYYDAAGVFSTNVGAYGEKTITIRDALDRPVNVEIRNGSNHTVRNTATYYSVDHNSVLTVEGTGATAITNAVFTDTFGNAVLKLSFIAGEYVQNAYDAAGNLVLSRDELGHTNSFAYDALNRLTFKILPDGASATNFYDGAGNLLTNALPGGLKWIGIYDSASHLRTNWLKGSGGEITRGTTNTYFVSGSFAGLLQQTVDGRGVVQTNGYDDYLRLSASVLSGSASEQNLTNQYQYDKRGLMTGLNQISQSGNTLVTNTYDGYRQLTTQRVFTNGVEQVFFTQYWSEAGRRGQLAAVGMGAGSEMNFTYRADRLMITANQSEFEYGDNGLLISRSNPWRTVTVNERDARGRLKQVTTTAASLTPMVETLNWRGNSTVDGYTVVRQGAGTWNETRDYSYNSRGQLTGETFTPWSGASVTATYGFDANKLGVRTLSQLTGSLTNKWSASSGQPNGLGRLAQEKLDMGKWFQRVRGTALGAETVAATVDGNPASAVFYNTDNPNGEWEAETSFATGNHTLIATATHPWNGATNYSVKSTNTFTAQANSTVDVGFDGMGNVTSRSLMGGKTQTLTWDGLGRLVKVAQRDSGNSGYDWMALYDGLGRRLMTVQTDVVGGVSSTNVETIESYYDPEVEFQEVGVSYNGRREWKLYGPDLNGVYGGLMGIGGLETVVRESDGQTTAVLNNYFGDVVATVSGGAVKWGTTQFASSGPVLGYEPPRLSYNIPLAEALGRWGKRQDGTGFYYYGARYLHEGRFLSADPMGFGGSTWDLYGYANGDMLNCYDPDGRYGKSALRLATGIDLDSPTTSFAEQVQAHREGGAEWVHDYIGFGVDLTVATLFSPAVDNRDAYTQNYLDNYGFTRDPELRALAGSLGQSSQDALNSFYFRGSTEVPSVQQRPTAWGAPTEPIRMRDSLPVYQLNEIPPPQQQQQPIVTVLGSAKDVAQYANKPGFNVLQMPQHITQQSQKDAYNQYWMMNAYTRGDSFWLVTDPAKFSQTLQNAGKSPNVSAYFRVELPILDSFNIRQNAAPAYNVPGGPPTIVPQRR